MNRARQRRRRSEIYSPKWKRKLRINEKRVVYRITLQYKFKEITFRYTSIHMFNHIIYLYILLIYPYIHNRLFYISNSPAMKAITTEIKIQELQFHLPKLNTIQKTINKQKKYSSF